MANQHYYNLHKAIKTSGVLMPLSKHYRNLSSQKVTGPFKESDLPEPPTECCNSGCDNCVWIIYAEELLKKFSNGGEMAKATIIKHVKDPSMRAFLLAELKALEKENKNK